MTTTEAPTSELLTVDPTTLVVGVNVRSDADLDTEFVASIKERGVLEPITVRRGDQGELIVLRGQRRTRAACKAKLPAVRVIVESDPDEIDRITDQVTENYHRRAMTTADEVAAVEQLALLGVSAAQIHKRTRLGKDTVEKALRVSKSQVAKEIAASHELTIDQLATVDEFADDPETVAKLTAAAQEGKFEHAAEIARTERADRELVDARIAELRAAGVPNICREAPAYDSGARQVYGLEGWSHSDTPEEAEAKHRDCPGNLVYVHIRYGWDDETRERVKQVHMVPFCTDFKGNGHKEHAAYGTATTEKTDEDREREAAERKLVIANNKLWKAATTVRRAWIRQDLMQRKSLPGVEAFVLSELLHCNGRLEEALSGYHGHRKYRDAMGLETERPQDKFSNLIPIADQLATLREATALWPPKKMQVHTAALIFCAWEEKTEELQVWRNPTDLDARMLHQLAVWGYELAEIEHAVIDEIEKRNQAAKDKAEQPGARIVAEGVVEFDTTGDPEQDAAAEEAALALLGDEDQDDDEDEVDYSGLDEFKPKPDVTDDRDGAPTGAIVIGGVTVAVVEHHDLTEPADTEEPPDVQDWLQEAAEEGIAAADVDGSYDPDDDPMDDIA